MQKLQSTLYTIILLFLLFLIFWKEMPAQVHISLRATRLFRILDFRNELHCNNGLFLSPSIVKVRVAGWWSLSLSPSIVKVRVAGWWSLSASFYR